MLRVVRAVKEKYKVKVRVDTNGLVNCMFSDAVNQLERVGLDEIRISLNAVNEEDYIRTCRPKLENAFSNLISFVKECAGSNISTYVSFVTEFYINGVKSRTEKEYLDFALSLGIDKENVIFREFVPQTA